MLRVAIAGILVTTLMTLAAPAEAIVKGPLTHEILPAQVTSGPSGYDPVAEPGRHIVTHFRYPSLVNQEILHVLNADGDLALRLRIHAFDLEAFDSGPTPKWRTLASIRSSWERLDIVLEGDTATIALNQYRAQRVNTSAHAEEGYLTYPSGQYPVYRGLTRYDGAHAVAMDAFTNPSHEGGWTVGGDASRIAVRPLSSIRHHSIGHLIVRAPVVPQPAVPGPAFLAVPVDALGGTYVAEVAVTPEASLFPPTGMVVLAGLSGSLTAPTTEWEVRIERVPSTDLSFHLVYHGADGTSAVLSSPWASGNTLRHLRAVVDEPSGRLAFVVDQAPSGVIVTPPGGLGASAWVALGDLGLCVCDDPRLGNVLFDDLAVIDIP
ncbi:MAG TPA: hypothetical protein VNZ52_17140 [Candidatus Thermoplasmatota archaeon]|nr:hypothetical protein [Candidatus Thermoplasmatota archaeon]